jgi:hypothetical protein
MASSVLGDEPLPRALVGAAVEVAFVSTRLRLGGVAKTLSEVVVTGDLLGESLGDGDSSLMMVLPALTTSVTPGARRSLLVA